MQLVSESSAALLRAHHPEAGSELARLETVLDQASIDADLLQLCRNHLHQAVRHQPRQPPLSLTPVQAACLDLCEQFTMAVSSVNDDQIRELLRYLSADEVYNLSSAIYVLEMSCRLDLTLQAVMT